MRANRILITGVGGPTPRSVARSLKTLSARSYSLIGTDSNPYALGLYQRQIFDRTYLVPRVSCPGYWDTIRAIVRDDEIDLALVLPELEVVEWARLREAGQLPCPALVPDHGLARLLTNKIGMSEVLEPHGLVPASIGFSGTGAGLAQVETRLRYPFWVRSASGSSGLGSLRVKNRAALDAWLGINSEVENFLASEFLPGRNLACKLLYYEGKLLRSACGERVSYIMAKVAPSGITGNTSLGRLLNDSHVVHVAMAAMEHLFDYAGAARHGFFTVDLKEDSAGTPLITEVNVRHVAFTGCFAAAGAFFAEDTLRLLAQDPTFELTYKQYLFPEGTIFLRDVDDPPIIMREGELLS
jgi:hypothetical protein